MQADDFLRADAAARVARGLNRTLVVIDGPQDARVRIGDRTVVCLCSNNYLGLARHPALIEAAARALRDLGTGAGASRLVSGSMRIHRDLEERLAVFKGTEAALLFNSGYHANTGVIPALVGKGDGVFSDALNHASLVDGCRLSRATVHIYPHGDVERLDDALASARVRRRLIVTDSLFSMDGDAAPLGEICDLAERYGAMVMVDEAHATGVLGVRGAGLVEQLGLGDRVTVQMGTLGKALGSFGAYVAGSRVLVDMLVNTARTFIYTTALPPAVAAAAMAALKIVANEPERRERLWRNARRLRRGLADAGFSVPAEARHIIPVMMGASGAAMDLAERLFASGVLARGIRPPTVPEGTARVRATVMATHSDADIDAALSAFRKAAPEPSAGCTQARASA